MQIFIYIVIISFLVRTIRNIFYLTFLWQLKEYRIDRILAHLKTPQGKKLFWGSITLTKWALFLGILIGYDIYFYYAFWSIWIIEAFFNIKELFSSRWRLPRFTPKTTFILSIILFIIIDFLMGNITDIETTILSGGVYVDRFIGLTIAIIIGILNLPVDIYKKFIISRAKNRMDQLKKLTVIGITGSYGKTSTKEFLATILSEKFKVAKTPEFTNTNIGIAKYILKELTTDHEIFVVEMGAYKKGEVKEICNMVNPNIGIITGINQQHLELFGSLKNTIKTKFELIESLPKNGIAIFNGNNKYCLQMADWSKNKGLKTLIYNKTKDAKNIKIFTDHIEFTLVSKNKNYRFFVNLLGEQTIENLLAAVCTAESLGLTLDEIKKGIGRIALVPKTMQLAGKLNGMILVDDTFNANPDGVEAAADFMKTFKGKKILVLTPLIELGEEAEKIHAQLGEKLSKICDLILLTNLNYHKSFSDGARKVGGEDKVQIVNTFVGLKLIKENLDEDGVVVFEGKEAGKILKRLDKLD